MKKRRDAKELRRFHHEVLRKMGIKIAALRKERGLTPAQLARACKLRTDSIRKIEQGRLNTRLSTMLKIADHFGITMEQLYDGIP